MDNVPPIDITDDFFNFELVETNIINFVSWNSGTIITKTNDISYFKIEKGDKTSYWYVEGINRVLKDGFELKISMDIYMSYTRKIINMLKSKNPILERVFFNRKMFKTKPNLRKVIYYSFKIDDELFDNAEFTYNRLVTSDIPNQNTKFPWNLDVAEFKTPNVIKANATAHIQSSDDENSNKFTQQYGFYLVMLHGPSGKFHLYPINEKVLSVRINNDEISKRYNSYCYNTYFDLMKIIANRYPPQKVPPSISNIHDGTGYGYWGVRDIETFYQENSFQGIYKAPHFLQNSETKYHTLGWIRPEHVTSGSYRYDIIYHYYLEHNPLEPLSVSFPKTLEVNKNMIDTYIELSQPYYWGKTEFVPRKYLNHYEFNKLNNTNDDTNLFDVRFNVSFLGEFIGTPQPTPYTDETQMISFGGQLSSASTEYMNQIRKIQQTYDTGLVNAKIGLVQGIPSAIGKAASADAWGVTSIIGSGITFIRDKLNLIMNKKNSTVNVGTTHINSSTSDWYYYNFLSGELKKYGLASDYNPVGRPDWIYLKEGIIQKEFTQDQKDQIKFILTNYGFKLNTTLNFGEWYENLESNDVAFIKFNPNWLSINIPSTLNYNIPNEILNKIIMQLSDGIRFNMGWR